MNFNLFDNLPRIYREADKDTQLRRFLEVFQAGLEEFEKYVVDFEKLKDASAVHPTLLGDLVDNYNIDFPYTLSIERRRKFVENYSTLIQLKGKGVAFEYLARSLFAKLIDAQVINDGNTFIVNLELDEDPENVEASKRDFLYLANQFRPVNTTILMAYVLVFIEEWNRAHQIMYRTLTKRSGLDVRGASNILAKYIFMLYDKHVRAESKILDFDYWVLRLSQRTNLARTNQL